MCQSLLTAGADKEAKHSATGSTPLHIVAAIGRAEACEVLLAAGADIAARDSCRRTAKDCAVASGHTHLAGLLQSRAEEVRLREMHSASAAKERETADGEGGGHRAQHRRHAINAPLLGEGRGEVRTTCSLDPTGSRAGVLLALIFILVLAAWVLVEWISRGDRPTELAALRAFRQPRDWTGDNPCAGWTGVHCSGLLWPTVTGLFLGDRRGDVAGDVAALAPLVHLTYLRLSSTAVSGTIPPAYGGMAALGTLDLDNTQLSGTIPEALGQAAALRYLDLHNTQLSGTIPEGLRQAASLRSLGLRNTQLSGTIPEALGQSLTALYLSGTGVTGCLDFCGRHPRISDCRCPTNEQAAGAAHQESSQAPEL